MPLSRRDWVEERRVFRCRCCGYSDTMMVHEVNFCGNEPTRYEIGDPVPEYWPLVEREEGQCFAVHVNCPDCGRCYSHGVGHVEEGKIARIRLFID